MLGLGDHEVAALPAHRRGLAEHQLDPAGIALDPAFRLGDDLLRDDEDVAFLEPARTLDRVAEERREVVPAPHLGNSFERRDRDHGVRDR